MLTGHGAAAASLDSASAQISPGAGVSISSSGKSDRRLERDADASLGRPGPGKRPSAECSRSAPARPCGRAGYLIGCGGPADRGQRHSAEYPDHGRRHQQCHSRLANQESQRIVEQTIRQIDRPQRQIAIEATIAEVTLNDRLTYGVQFFLASQKGSIVNTVATSPGGANTIEPPSNAAAGALFGRAIPGFNLLVGAENSARVILDALHGLTDVKILSNPSLVVLDNQAATLQVGDQVPFSTGTATAPTANNTVVNTIDYKNTGIILRAAAGQFQRQRRARH
jgi:general secretion pathway protein D